MFMLDIFSSKGLTFRNPTAISWNIVSIDSSTTSTERNTLDAFVSANFINMKFIKFDSATIGSLTNKVVEVKATVTNFLGKTGSGTILVNFSNTKKIIIEGLYSSYLLVDNEDQRLFLTVKLPYCSGDNRATLLQQEESISIW